MEGGPGDSGRRACLVVGAGEFTGAAVARRFAREGFVACLVRRPRHAEALEAQAAAMRAEGLEARAMPADARDEAEVVALFDRIEEEGAPLGVVVFNIGANVRHGIEETSARVYRKVWEMAAFAGFLTGREAARRMTPRGEGTIIFTGATASVRGGSGYAAFAGAKHALRALAQSMARELGPKGIHVAHVVIDGPIDTDWIRENFPQVFETDRPDPALQPDDIAEAYLALHRQNRSAWTHEIDLRPWGEKW